MSSDEVDLLKWPEPLPPSWQCASAAPAAGWDAAFTVTEDGTPAGTVSVAFVASTPSRHLSRRGAGPAHRARAQTQDPRPSSWSRNRSWPRIRPAAVWYWRLMRAMLPGLPAARRPGYRYVLDVDVPGRSLSLLTAEPDWVLEDSRHLDDVPTK